MLPTAHLSDIAPTEAVLEPAIAAVERCLGELARALLERESHGVDSAATALQRALAGALDAYTHHARRGPVPPALRQRLVRASGQVASQRETLARATAALDRAIEVLIPRAAMVYNARGAASLVAHSGSVRA